MPADVTVSSWLAEWRAEGWDAPHVIVNVGAIDSDDAGQPVVDVCTGRGHLHGVVVHELDEEHDAGNDQGEFEAPFLHLLEYRDGKLVRGEFYADSAKAAKVLA